MDVLVSYWPPDFGTRFSFTGDSHSVSEGRARTGGNWPAGYGETNLVIGPEIEMMTDQEIIDSYNETLKGQAELARKNKYVAVEPPLGSPQIKYHPGCDQWTPSGDVLRCVITDGAKNGREPVIEIDDKELSWAEFGTMLCTYAGWGMRIEFTPEDAIHRRPALEVREPKK